MKKPFIVCFVFLLSLSTDSLAIRQGDAAGYLDLDSTTRPNILVIMTDDQGQWASTVYGNHDLFTPNMELLARSGVAFANAYAVSPVCSPSRASFFTGRMPSQHGVHDFLSESEQFDYNWLKNEILLSELLQDSGYRTGLVGKWHATTNSALPQPGFDYWFSYDAGVEGWQNQYLHGGTVHFSEQGSSRSLTGYQSQRLTDQAIEFMDQQPSQQPFFLYLGLVDTHEPFSGLPERLVARYRPSSFQDIPKDESSFLPPRSDRNKIPGDHHQQLAQYYAAVQLMDEQLGRLIDYLDIHGILDHTLIIFTSDHGHLNGHHGLYGKGNATRPQNFYQETILVPLIMSWPAEIGPIKEKLTIPVNNCDLFQTILEAAGVNLTGQEQARINSPGKSLLPYFKHPNTGWHKYQYSELGNARMIADGKQKFVRRYPPMVGDFGNEFYDLENDPRETQNMVDDPTYKDQVRMLSGELDLFFLKYQDPTNTGTNLQSQPPANANEQWREHR